MDIYIVLKNLNMECLIHNDCCSGRDDVETANSLSSRCYALREESL
jgi:hypothetical protein